MSVSLLAFLKHAAKCCQVSVHVTVARSFSDSSAICYVLLVFVDNVMFHVFTYGQESDTTLTFSRVPQVAAPVERHSTSFGQVLRVVAPGVKPAISSCILLLARLHIV